MPADCYFCRSDPEPNPVDIPLGTKGNPVGGCKRCSAFACGFHGSRDNNGRGFVCVVCVPSVVHSSSLIAVGSPTRAQFFDELQRPIGAGLTEERRVLPIFTSVDDFIARMASYNGAKLRAEMNQLEVDPRELHDKTLQQAVAASEGNSRDLLVLSAILTNSLGPAKKRVHPDVLAISNAVHKRTR